MNRWGKWAENTPFSDKRPKNTPLVSRENGKMHNVAPLYIRGGGGGGGGLTKIHHPTATLLHSSLSNHGQMLQHIVKDYTFW